MKRDNFLVLDRQRFEFYSRIWASANCLSRTQKNTHGTTPQTHKKAPGWELEMEQ